VLFGEARHYTRGLPGNFKVVNLRQALSVPFIRVNVAATAGPLVFSERECDYPCFLACGKRRPGLGTKGGFLMLKRWFENYKWLIVLATLSLAGCASWSWNGTQVNTSNRLVSAAGEPLFSTVYFLRPRTERAMGFSDNTLTISLDGSKLLTIEKGDYTLVYMRPRVRTTMTLENRTEVGPFWKTKKMDKDYKFGFTAGETYFIVLEPVDGEFRGVYFTARNVDLFTAKQLAQNLRPAGEARKAPLGTL
jgi:hypothetical protein